MRSGILLFAILLLAACDMGSSDWSPSRGACRDRDTIPGDPLGAECWDWLSGGGSNR